MFSGIVNGFASISKLQKKEDFQTFTVALFDELQAGLKIGASVSIDGVCMTVTKIEDENVYFDAMKETLDCTTIGNLTIGSQVNIERSLKFGDEVGGHHVSGHVHGKAKIVKIDRSIEDNCIIFFLAPQNIMKYLFTKGFVSLNGASLTLVDVDKEKNLISVYLIPETLRKTTFGIKEEGDYINIEIDTQTQSIVDTVESYLAAKGVNL
ncbi:MAG: riboflavin synthase subunit alpha [Thiomargarita sp.]|nr:riboflavin synthase subunit alpha [Thiomargarita sp.]